MTEETQLEDVKEEQEFVETAEQAPESSQEQKDPEVGSKEYNFRRMEQKMRQLEEQNDELRREMMRAQAPKPQEEPDELSQLAEDDLVTYGQVSKYTEKLAEKKARELLEQEFQKRERAQQPTLARQKFTDYDQVVTVENIEQLTKEDPELEELIQKAKNPCERAYREIKKSEFWRKKHANKEVEEKIDQNSKKPLSSNSLGKQRPLSQAAAYSKDELYKEMMQYGQGGY